jgi:glycosyltransferase involved in cell wall biosynthesis
VVQAPLQSTAMADVAVIVLTYNEEINIAQALDSVAGWAREIFILDSFSTDRTLDIARPYGCHITQHTFENYARQRNHALDVLPIRSEWILFLDADEWLPDALKREIATTLAGAPAADGFYLNRRLIWMGRWIRRGYYPSWILRLFRRGKGRCEDRQVNEHLIVEGPTAQLREDFMHEDRKGVSDWIAKHNRYASLEAQTLLAVTHASEHQELDARWSGTQAQRKRWLRHRVWNRMPPLIRPFFYFLYRYIVKGGFLDGREAFIFHFLQALWFPMLIDIKYLELRSGVSKGTDAAGQR